MITAIKSGHYQLIETKGQVKILTLDTNIFAWINVATIGELLVTSHRKHKTDNILAVGKYRLYDVKNEPKLTDLLHLELFVGDGKWQGYLLLTGLPTIHNQRKRIIPTPEVITRNHSIT